MDIFPTPSDFLAIMERCGWTVSSLWAVDETPDGDAVGQADVVTAWNVVGSCDDPEALCCEALKRLTPGGVFVASQSFASGDALGRASFEACFKAARLPFVLLEVRSAEGPTAIAWTRRAGHLTNRDFTLREWLTGQLARQRSERPEETLLGVKFGLATRGVIRAVGGVPVEITEAVSLLYTQGTEPALTALESIPSLPPEWGPIIRRLIIELHRMSLEREETSHQARLSRAMDDAKSREAEAHQFELQLSEIRESFMWTYVVPIIGVFRRLLPSFVKSRLLPLTKKWRRIEPHERWAVMRAYVLARVWRVAPRLFRLILPATVRERVRAWSTPRYPTISQQPWDTRLPLVSVIIPCFNYGAYLGEAVASVDAQTLGNVELIVVDDGSTDALTRQVLRDLAASRSDIRVISQPNSGLPAARNAGIRVAKGKYISCLDADDLFDPTYLEKAVAVLESRPDVALAYSWVQLFGDEQEMWETQPFDPRALLHHNFVSVSAVFRRDIWAAVGGYNEEMTIGYEDWEFWLRVGATGAGGVVIPEPLFRHRRHGRTMTHRARDQHTRLATSIRKRTSNAVMHSSRRARVEVIPDEAFINMRGTLKTRHRLLIVAPWTEVGGADHLLLQILEGFKRAGHWDLFVITTLPSANSWRHKFLALTPYLYDLPAFLPPHQARAYLTSFVKLHGIDAIVISHSAMGYELCRRWRSSQPSVVITDLLHNDLLEGYLATSIHEDDLIDMHFVVSDQIAERLHQRRIPADKVTFIGNGVTTESFFPDSQRGHEWTSANGLLNGRPKVGFIGRLSPEKNPELFARIAARLGHIDADWLVVGEGPLARSVSKLSSALGPKFRMLGTRDDVPDILRALDLLLVTSNGEGEPLVVIEALLTGVPVMATDVGSLRSMIAPSETGHIVSKGDEEAFVKIVGTLLGNPVQLRDLQSTCRTRIEEQRQRYSGSRMAAAYMTHIERLLEKDSTALRIRKS